MTNKYDDGSWCIINDYRLLIMMMVNDGELMVSNHDDVFKCFQWMSTNHDGWESIGWVILQVCRNHMNQLMMIN